jgi:predicted HicB family RNase H-like nuclease
MSEDIITSLRIDKELWKRAKKYAIDHDMSIREFIEKLIREKLDEKEGGG